MNIHEAGSLLAFQPEDDREHEGLVRLYGILSHPMYDCPSPFWDLDVLEESGMDATGDRGALVLPAGSRQ